MKVLKFKALLLLPFLVLLFLSPESSAQVYQWAKKIGSTDQEYIGRSMTVDKSGNVYIAGSQTGPIDLDPGPGTATVSGNWFLAKYDANGNYIWGQNIATIVSGTWGLDVKSHLRLDTAGNIYLAGEFRGGVSFGPGPNAVTLTSTGASDDGFFAKYDINGNLDWIKQITGDNVPVTDLEVDRFGNIFITGEVNDGTNDYDPGPGSATLPYTVQYSHDLYFAKYDNSGNYLWVKGIDAGGNDCVPRLLKADKNGNIYVSGVFEGTNIDFDPGPGTALFSTFSYPGVGNSEDGFIAKYDNNGVFIWNKVITGKRQEGIGEMTFSASGNIYITGKFNDTVDFDPGPGVALLNDPPSLSSSWGEGDCFVAKYDSSFNYIWAFSIGGNRTELGNSLVLDAQENLCVFGEFNSDTVDLDPGPADARIWNGLPMDNNFFISSYDSAGHYRWGKGIGDYYDDRYGTLGIDTASNVYITGNFQGTANFNPGGAPANLTSSGIPLNNSPNPWDIFIAKYSPCALQAIADTQSICRGDVYQVNGHIYATTGIFIDTMLSVGGCDSIVTTHLTVSTIDTSLNIAGDILTANASGASYQWIDCATNTAIAGATSQSFTATANGSYAVVLTQNSCSDTSACITITNVGIGELAPGEEQFAIYPNPGNGEFIVESKLNAALSIYDPTGRRVHECPLKAGKNVVDTRLSSGGYFLDITNSGKVVFHAVITIH